MLDPFIGTGSLLVSAAYFGAVCMGTDIDYATIKGKGSDKHIMANFRQYVKKSYVKFHFFEN